MKICYLADIRSIHTKRWVEWFARDNVVHLITCKYPEKDRLDMENVIVHDFLPRLSPRIVFNGMVVKKLVEKIRPDVLHSHYATHYGYWGACSGFHPFVISGWGDDFANHPDKWYLNHFVMTGLRKADLITCDGYNLKDNIVRHGIPEDKIMIVYHGVDTDKFPYHFNPDGKTVIYMRGTHPTYDYPTFAQAMQLVKEKIPDVNILEVFGVPHEQIPEYLAKSDVYVSTSLSDGGMAVSSLEAMACGVVPVLTDVGDNARNINGKNGFVMTYASPYIISELVSFLLNNPANREEMSKYAREYVLENQDYSKNMEKMNVLYQELIA